MPKTLIFVGFMVKLLKCVHLLDSVGIFKLLRIFGIVLDGLVLCFYENWSLRWISCNFTENACFGIFGNIVGILCELRVYQY